MDMKLELVAVPVTDVDRAKAFYVDQRRAADGAAGVAPLDGARQGSVAVLSPDISLLI
jgi:catechol 2,3-dioxygenase-like lactoylglutathione lyase family enzyme